MKELLPLIGFAVALWIGAGVGNWLTQKTGRRLIGWPAGLLLFFALMALSGILFAAPRSHAARAAFQRNHPCPANDNSRGPCPGYIVDHIIPLCAGGEDMPGNMQWQTVADASIKDQEERRVCRKGK